MDFVLWRSKPAAGYNYDPATDKDFNKKYPSLVQALSRLPNETVIDDEIVAVDESGRPSFSAVQNYPLERLSCCTLFSMSWSWVAGT